MPMQPISMMVHFNPGTVPSMEKRMEEAYRAALIVNLKAFATLVIEDAKSQLQPGHGYDTGLMHDTLTSILLEELLEGSVIYSLESEQAYYWKWVEFGHMTVAGNWWEGYHFLQNAVDAHRVELLVVARASWAEAAASMRVEGDFVRLLSAL